MAELDHGFMPGKRVEIDRVEQGAVEIKDSGFGHKAFLQRPTTFAYQAE